MRFKILYVIFLIVCIFYPSSKIIPGLPISIRHILILIMLFLCIRERGIKKDRFVTWYIVFLFFYGIAEVSTGFASFFITTLFGTYLSAITLYYSSKVMVEKYDAGRWVLYTIIIMALLNSIVAIGQFFGSPIAQLIPQALGISFDEATAEFYEQHSDFHGFTVDGLMGPVSSGYFLSAACALVLYNKSGKTTILNYLLLSICFIALFLIQERAGLAFGILGVLICFLLYVKKNRTNLLVLIPVAFLLLFLIIRYAGQFVSFENMRYATEGLSDEHRSSLLKRGLDYFLNHPFGGNTAYYVYNYGGAPHTVFINAFLYGGLFGGIIVLGIMFKQITIIMGVLKKAYIKKCYSFFLIVFCVAYLVYTLNSFVHNHSLPFGTPMFFVLWGVVVATLNKENNNNHYQTIDEITVLQNE